MLNLYQLISNTQIFKKFKVDDLLFVEYRCLGDEERMTYWNENNCFVFIFKGKKKWETIGHEYTVRGGEAIFIKKGANIVHQYFDDDFCALLIFVPDEFIRNTIKNHHIDCIEKGKIIPTDSIINVHVDEILSTYSHSVYNYFLQSKTPPKDLLKIKFTELIINIMMSDENNALAGHFMQLCLENKVSIRSIMEANFAHNLRLDEFAELTARSLSTFKRDFIKIYGMPPGKWLTQKRLEHAKYLLDTTDKQVTDIVVDCGFENNSHFSRVFKVRFGVSPLHYRSNVAL